MPEPRAYGDAFSRGGRSPRIDRPSTGERSVNGSGQSAGNGASGRAGRVRKSLPDEAVPVASTVNVFPGVPMQYIRLSPHDREALLGRLEAMPAWLEETFSALSADAARRSGTDDLYSPVEQVWHLADLEQEGFGLRIERLMAEAEPVLADFDGAAIAAARRYKERSLAEGLEKFREARLANLATLRAAAPASWERAGTQVGVGRISLCDVPGLMAEHDLAHRAEIETWKHSPA